MSIHKLTAGSGYDYLTRQVAALDATEKGHTGLASYYTERGESPGVWVGSGMAGIDGLDAGDPVTPEQMADLFGAGMHPLTTQRQRELDQRIGRPPLAGTPSPTKADYEAASALGTKFKVYAGQDVSAFRVEVAKRLAAINVAAGLPADWAVPAAERARVRTEVAREFFTVEHGRDPVDAREIAATIARHSRPKTTAVAGYDLTFSPVKSVSTLWAVADPATAAAVERAHQAAISDALNFLERKALYTRLGTDGARQVDVRGLVATAFTHRDSRAGDPDLHTHVAVANKVQTLSPDGTPAASGKWRAIDGRVLFKAAVAASETYNTALERHLTAALGVRFAERPNPDARKRPVREILGVNPAVNEQFSKRRLSVEQRRNELAANFQAIHGRPPTPVETLQLSQQATLETRQAKHEPRTLAEQRATWHREAASVLGSPAGVEQMVRDTLAHNQAPRARSVHPPDGAPSAWLPGAAERVVATMENGRASWQYWHVYAEAQRQVRTTLDPAALGTASLDTVPPERVRELADQLTREVLQGRSVSLSRAHSPAPRPDHDDPPGIHPDTDPDADRGVVEPVELRRTDGSSVYTVAGAEMFTSTRVLAAEERLVTAAGRADGHAVDPSCVDLALLESPANGATLNAGQTTLVRQMATSGARLQLAIAPAGAGKTTAMRALTGAWVEGGGTVVGLAPSAAAAAALRDSISDTSSVTVSAIAAPHGGAKAVQHRVRTDTLAKLTWSLDQAADAPVPAWVEGIDASTLVVIDEAGMADTLSLARAVDYVLSRGGSVRLIGDDQQLAAIGAGGVLRDIAVTHGALQLSELMRFTDPAEGAASLALREGKTEALGFYLDRHRVHVGDLATMTEDVFAGWQADRGRGLDAIMLAPTRELVSELNQRARAHRLAGLASASPDTASGTATGAADLVTSRRLADGNEASVGELIITRSNDRRLRVSATDWVKNGDRWTVLALHDPADGGGLTVQHTQHGRTVRLPAAYVEAATELGYATTIHTAQGVTADTMHGLTTGEESRQHLYTMLTRGRAENHVYLQVVGDGDPHSLIHPEMTHPQTPIDLLQRMLAHDDTPRSATTLGREAAAPTTRLGQATARYLDSLYLAAEQHLEQTRPGLIAALDQAAGTGPTKNAPADPSGLVGLAGLSETSAWPTLRAHLLLLAAGGADPLQALAEAAAEGQLDTAGDRAAVLDWRLDATGLRNTTGTAGPPQPLPWLPAVPADLAADPHWGTYLNARADLVADLADQIRTTALASTGSGVGVGALPVWARNGLRPNPRSLADVEVWRAAMRVDPADRRPTGPAQQATAAATYQRRLNRRLTGDHTPALAEWNHLLNRLAPTAASDEFAPLLAERLAAMTSAGIRADRLVHAAAVAGPLPDEHAAAALWWRMSRHLTPAVAAQIDDQVISPDHQLTTTWVSRLPKILGHGQAKQVQASTWWPALVTNLDHALHRGWQLEDLLTAARPTAGDQPGEAHDDVEGCLALVWRTSIALDPVPEDPDGPESPLSHGEAAGEFEEPPEDLWEGVDPADYAERYLADQPAVEPALNPSTDPASSTEDPTMTTTTPATAGPRTVETALALAGMIRDAGRPRPLEPTESDVRRMLTRAHEWDTSPITRERMLAVNDLAAGFYQTQLPGSWAQQHLLDRFGVDLSGHETIRPGYAPRGWTPLVDHLRRHGVTDAEMLATGVASTARTGRLIDRFRDRVVFPITHPARHQDRHQAGEPGQPPSSEVLGFVGRRHPDLTDHDQHVGPKYLNTGETLLFHKGAQLFGVDHAEASAQSPVPVIVEGPMDAIAVTVSTAGSHVGVAALGTSLTEEQAAQLAQITHDSAEADTGQWRDPILATDADLAGQVAAERAYWMLTPHGFDPGHAPLPAGYDPADLLALRGPAAVAGPLAVNTPLAERLLAERLNHLPANQAGPQAAAVLAARPGHTWDAAAETISDHTGQPVQDTQRRLLDAVRTWDADPRKAAATQLATTQQVRERMKAAAQASPAQRWSRLANQLDPRLTSERDWPITAELFDEAAKQGHDVATAVRGLLADRPLGDRPARDLRYRFVSHADLALPSSTSTRAAGPDPGADDALGGAHVSHDPPARPPSR